MGALDASQFEGMGHGIRVVVVDDDRDAATTLGMLLQGEGFEVTLVQNANAVAAAVARARPHAVLLDLVMRERNGMDVAAELRGMLGAACPALIAVSGLDDPATRALAAKRGFSHFIAKPYELLEIMHLLSSLNPPRKVPAFVRFS